MSIEPAIKEIIKILNLEWFEEIHAEFLNHPHYNKKLLVIEDIVKDIYYGMDSETGEEEIIQDEIIIQASLKEYAWDGAASPYEDQNGDWLIFKGKSLVEKIVTVIGKLLEQTHSLAERYQIIKTVDQYINDQEEVLKNKTKNKKYHETISYCIRQLRYEVKKRYSTITNTRDTITDFKDRICFDLSQKELAFLLTILIDADLIHGASLKNSTFLDFAKNYFYFQNQKDSNNFTKAINIHKKISDVKGANNADYNDIKTDMKRRLINAIDSI